MAAEWGFTRILIPKDQKIPEPPQGNHISEVENIEIGSIEELLIKLIQLCGPRNDDNTLRVLRKIDTTPTLWRNQELVKRYTSVLIDSEDEEPGLASLAHYVRHRMYLHNGKGDEEKFHFKKHRELCDGNCISEYLNNYITYEPYASKSVSQIDAGVLDDEGESHKELDSVIEELHAKLKRPRTVPEKFQKDICMNTRAMRRCFLGRLKQDMELLELSWDDATNCILENVTAWKDQTAKVGVDRSDTSIQRRLNLLIDIQVSMKDISPANYILAENNLNLLEELESEFTKDQTLDYLLSNEEDAYTLCFNLLAWLKLQYLLNRDPNTKQIIKIVEITKNLENLGDCEYLKTCIYEYILHRFPSTLDPKKLIPPH